MMKPGLKSAGIAMALLLISPALIAQSPAAAAAKSDPQHLRVDLVLTEFNGGTKVSSLPYTMYVAVSTPASRKFESSLRLGVRVPIATGPVSSSNASFQYEHVGTDLDCSASSESDGQFQLQLRVDRSSVYTPDANATGSREVPTVGGLPIVRDFTSSFDVSLRDGQTVEGLSGVDPLDGHILKVSVTIHVEK